MSEQSKCVDQKQLVLNRLRRAQGQLGAVITMVEEDRSCEEVIGQLAAVTKALERAGFKLIATSLKECLEEGHGDIDKLEKVFLSLA